MLHNSFDKARELLVVGTIAVLVGVAVYTALGLAWTFKTAVETAGKLIPSARFVD